MTGDSKMQSEGKADQAEGKIQNTIGGIKDSIKDAFTKLRKGAIPLLRYVS